MKMMLKFFCLYSSNKEREGRRNGERDGERDGEGEKKRERGENSMHVCKLYIRYNVSMV